MWRVLVFLFVLTVSEACGADRITVTAHPTLDDRYPGLAKLLFVLRSATPNKSDGPMFVPSTWMLDPTTARSGLEALLSRGELVRPVKIESFRALLATTVERLFALAAMRRPSGKIDVRTGHGVISVNGLARLISCYDLDLDGRIGTDGGRDITLNSRGWRETGTLIRDILALPYFVALGYNTIHLQPITRIGVYGRKGDLGSPFAIRDPFSLDPTLSDPLVSLPPADQFRAFVDAAHAAGLKVILEVIPRTVSIDSDVLEKNPSYGYWVREGSPKRMPNYYSPSYDYSTSTGSRRFADRASFDQWFFKEYRDLINKGRYGLNDLIDVTRTDPEYSSWFLPPPDRVRRESTGRLVGEYYKKDARGHPIPGQLDAKLRSEVFPAFCDTPFEIQPFWQDVSYLRLYHDSAGSLPILGPLSFVTAKFFKNVEPVNEEKYRYKPVWEMITDSFARYRQMGVDGVVLDMGHALPTDLKRAIRRVIPNVWEENADADPEYLAKTPGVVTGGTFSYAIPSFGGPAMTREMEDHPDRTARFHIENVRKLFTEISLNDRYRGKMFGAPDNYNTKRIGQTVAARNLKSAPRRQDRDVLDFTRAPVDPVKARRITLLYHALFRLASAYEGSPFVFNPIFGTEFVPTSTINVGMATHIDEANAFSEYQPVERRAIRTNAPRLLLMSKPVRPGEEWVSDKNFVRDILNLERVVEQFAPVLSVATKLELVDGGCPEVLVLVLRAVSRKTDRLAIVANLDPETERPVRLPRGWKRLALQLGTDTPLVTDQTTMRLSPGGLLVLVLPEAD